MSKIYLMFVDTNPGAVDWITYSRAHMLCEALPNCAGIFKLSQPPASLKTAPDGWNLYLLCHGDHDSIGDMSGEDLANALHDAIPVSTLGFMHLQSCQTGQRPAGELATALGNKGHQVIVKAPVANATFTGEVGFRVLDVGRFTPELRKQYNALKAQHETKGIAAATGGGASGNLQQFCRSVYMATEAFWTAFSALFEKCAMPMGNGWVAYETDPGKGAHSLP